MKTKRLFLSLAMSLMTITTWADVAINETNFPDEKFRDYLLNRWYGSDGILTDAEIAGIDQFDMSLPQKSIQSLKGIEFLTALKYLHCEDNQLTSLDVSKNTVLKSLYCNSNQLTALDISKNTALTGLTCNSNNLTSLDVSKNTALIELRCANNQLTSLDVSNNTTLTKLLCSNNQLTSLDISKNTALKRLESYNNQLTSLDISGCTVLTESGCFNNKLTSLDVSGCAALTTLDCSNNQLNKLDVSGCTALTGLSCCSNQIKGAAMDALVESLPTVSKGSILVINNENEGNVMTTTQVAAAKAKGWVPYYYDGSNWLKYAGSEPELAKGIEINETTFPDESFRNWLLSQSYGADGMITDEEIAAVTYISVPEMNIKSLKGIEYFTELADLSCSGNQLTELDLTKNIALVSLSCANNQLTSLDVSKNKALKDLNCNGNQMTSLDVSECTALTELSCKSNKLNSLKVSGCVALITLFCEGNQLTSLDVSKNIALTSLSCGSNKLTSLDVSQNIALQGLYCSSNQLTSLDISKNTSLASLKCHRNQLTSINIFGCTSLMTIFCYQNQLKGKTMETFIENLPNIDGGSLKIIYNEDEGNIMTTTQVASARDKGWDPQCYDESNYGPYYTWKSYYGSEPELAKGIEINETTFPDESFRNWLLSQDYGSDEIITSEEIATITKINVQGKGIQSLHGIEYFTALTRLNCYNNQITSLDVSKNANLEEIDCGKNMLTSLDVSKNTKLTKELRFTENQIASIDLSNNIMLQSLGCAGNQLTSLDISNNTELTDVDCYNNHLTSLDVSKNTKLTYISCHSNQLTSLDFSNNPELEDLYCYNNCLTSLNVTGCSALTYLEIYRNSIYGKSMDAFIESLPTVSNRPLKVVDNQNEGNFMTTTQVAAAKAKGWTPQYAEYPWQEYAGSEPEVLRGDVNGDGEVDMDDATFVTNIILGTEDATKEADVNNDGTVSMPDAMFIVNKILNGKFPDE